MHEDVKKMLEILLNDSELILKIEDKNQIGKYISHREYYHALQWYCGSVIQEKKTLSSEQIRSVLELMHLMGVDQENDSEFWLWEQFTENFKTDIVVPRECPNQQ
jgi:hypothetical protein